MSGNTLHILLADDDADDRLFFKEAIEEVKIKTILTTVKNGVQLMDYLNKPNAILPDVIFLDLNMPRKGGIACLTEIRNSSKLKNISIAIYSTSSSEKDIEETFIKGANIFINKPDDHHQLKKILTEVIRINWQYHKSGLNKENFLLNV
ncbi:MAG: response regulator [Bacteroidota bacterium]